MTTRRTTEEKIDTLNEKMRQYNARLKQLEARKKTEDRKKRTQRLIHIGAEVESILGAAIEDSDLPKLKKFLEDQERRGRYFSKAMGKASEDENENAGLAQ